MQSQSIKYIHFHNTTDLPIMLDSWVDGSNRLTCVRIGAKENRIVHSLVGEWHIQSMFENIEDCKLWKEAGLNNYILIGKFRSSPCAQGDYAWMEADEIFGCTYSENREDDIKGTITFSIKK